MFGIGQVTQFSSPKATEKSLALKKPIMEIKTASFNLRIVSHSLLPLSSLR
jgi:hypothetical protein